MRHGRKLHRADLRVGPEERFAGHAFINGFAPLQSDSGVGVNRSFPVGLAASDEGLVRLLRVRIVRHFVPFFERATPDDDVLFGPLKATPGRHIIQVRKAAISDAAWYGCRTCDEYFRCVGTDACVVSIWALPGDRVDMFGLHRDLTDRDFMTREVNLLRLFHAELGRIEFHEGQSPELPRISTKAIIRTPCDVPGNSSPRPRRGR